MELPFEAHETLGLWTSPSHHVMAEYRHLEVVFIAFKTLGLPMYHLHLINTSTPAEQGSVWFGYHSELN